MYLSTFKTTIMDVPSNDLGSSKKKGFAETT